MNEEEKIEIYNLQFSFELFGLSGSLVTALAAVSYNSLLSYSEALEAILSGKDYPSLQFSFELFGFDVLQYGMN